MKHGEDEGNAASKKSRGKGLQGGSSVSRQSVLVC